MAGIPPRQAPRWHVGTVLFALVPVVSLGLLAFAPAAYFSVLRRNVASWVALAFFAAMSGFEMYLSASAPNNEPGSGAGGFFLLTMFVPVPHYVISMRNWQRERAWGTPPAQPQVYLPPPYGHDPYQRPQPYLPPQGYQVQPPPQAQPLPLPRPYDLPTPLTEDVGAELRRLSERLRGPQGGEPGQ
jgi:hypothetical protein